MVERSREPLLSDEARKDLAEPFRVAVCLPAQDQVQTGFAYDLARLFGFTAARFIPNIVGQMHILISEGTLIAPQRANLVERAIERDCTHILWLDTDMRFPKDTLIRLLRQDEPIVGANYSSRRLPPKPTALTAIESENGEGVPLYTEPESSGIVSVEALGMGVMLTHVDVFRKLPLPWFEITYIEREGDYMGEDIYFCQKVRAAGYEVFVDQELSKQVSHVGSWEFEHDHTLAAREPEGIPG